MHQTAILSRPTAAPPAEARIGPDAVLIVEDDPAMRQLVSAYFAQHRCQPVTASEPDDAIRLMARSQFSLVILDIDLGERDGFELLRRIRAGSDIPVIAIAGERTDAVDRIVGLELGADDYLAKPFNLRELLARARSILRRQAIGHRFPGTTCRGGYRFAGWELRRSTRSLRDPAGRDMPLTKSGYALLVAFLNAPGTVLSREQLLRATRTHEDIFDRSVDVQVLRLRRTLEPDPSHPRLIQTERGIGYRFAAPVQPLF